MNFKKPLKID